MTKSANPDPSLDYPVNPKRWRALITLLSASFMSLLAISILNVSVPSLSISLGLTPTHVQWIMSGYALTFGLALVPAGRLGDVYGRRRLFIIGVSLFALVSITASLAQTPGLLVAMRLSEGIAAAIISPQMIGLIQQLFRGRERAVAFGYFGLVVGIATAIGPTLGGVLLAVLGTDLGWRAAFFVNVPVCVVVIILAFKLLPIDEFPEDKKLQLDLLGIIILGGAVLAVMLPFIQGSGEGKSVSQAPWWLLVLGLGLSALFLIWENWQEKRGRDVIVPRSLLLDPSYMVGTIFLAAYFAGFSAFFIIYTFYLQQGLGIEPWLAGVLQIPIAVASAIFSPLSSKLVVKIGRWLLFWSTLIVVTGLIGAMLTALYVSPAYVPYVLTVATFVIGAGSGLVVSPAQSLSLVTVPVETGATAGGVSQTAQRVGSAIGLACVTLVFYAMVGAGGEHLSPGTSAALKVYSSAFVAGMIAIVVMVAISSLIALADAIKRPHNPLA